MTYKERFLKDYPDIYEIDFVEANYSEADFKRFYTKLESVQYEWKELSLLIPMKPIEKSRPRASGSRIYDPDTKDKEYYARIVDFLIKDKLEELDIDKEALSVNEEIHISVFYYRSIPAGFSRVDRLLAIVNEINPTVTPDIDNYDKFIYDVLQLTSLYHDDSFITTHNNRKLYSIIPRIEIKMRYKTVVNS